MKKEMIAGVLALFIASLATSGFSAEDVKAPKAASNVTSAKVAQSTKTKGSISALDLKANTLSLSVDGKEVEVSIKNATVWMGGAKKALSDLKVGDKVSVRHHTVAGKQEAKSIEILPAAK